MRLPSKAYQKETALCLQAAILLRDIADRKEDPEKPHLRTAAQAKKLRAARTKIYEAMEILAEGRLPSGWGSATESVIRDLKTVSRDLEYCKYRVDLVQVGAEAMLQVDQDLNKKLARKNNE